MDENILRLSLFLSESGHLFEEPVNLLRQELKPCNKIFLCVILYLYELAVYWEVFAMSDVFKYAKYLIKNGYDTYRNTYDGNMKLQKLLFFADLVSMAIDEKPLFDSPILAFKNGCVIEPVRLRYKDDYDSFLAESMSYAPEFNAKEREVLELTTKIFGSLSPKELSVMNHSFSFWKDAFANSESLSGFRNKDLAVVSIADMKREIYKIKQVINAYYSTQSEGLHKEIVNGISFYYDPADITWTDELLEQVESFSENADETAYSISLDNGNLVIY